MSNILLEVLNKIGKKRDELTPQAKADFDKWETILTTGPVTIEKLKEFLISQKESLVIELASSQHQLNDKEDMFLRARLFDNMLILTLLENPKKASDHLVKYLKKLHNIK